MTLMDSSSVRPTRRTMRCWGPNTLSLLRDLSLWNGTSRRETATAVGCTVSGMIPPSARFTMDN
ncbi:hypothetical protein NC653_026608 [Populus alba x Populus x berolinensis]|uniref:Uncharacterized protein n=1 Tax=Populus alba x Populus x berolinensis TaxID=444605 RepID=A0AAD6Q9G0_9ROSI|nr:hypothetical protein NC653_026608 [Populus alba x Populus x berolinensis]